MKLSQRLWWSVAHHTAPDDPVECMVWAKVQTQLLLAVDDQYEAGEA